MVKYIITFMLLTTICAQTSYALEDNNMSMSHPRSSNVKKTRPTIRLEIYKIIDYKDKKVVRLKLKYIADNKPVTLDDLKEVHTQKIHILIIDDSLEDYSHVHPKALETPGLYEFEWHPKKHNTSYYMWADLTPSRTNQEEYVMANLISVSNVIKPEIDRSTVMTNTVQGYNLKLSFDSATLKAGMPVMGKIIISDAKGNMVKNLEPIMGAFAHIVAFSDDLKTIVHVHPMGSEPISQTDRGGPELQFHLMPGKAGFIKLFVQLKIKGKELFVPFGLNVLS